ncbi:hypothetical protein AGR5A_Lc110112 [Agrobacterium genomosp. 5 str. CFBP 6626]|nr:hypothetical protein AGR5A_Lc110112 [Agrobacterium genomosp. 5 str. CFBP 6626]
MSCREFQLGKFGVGNEALSHLRFVPERHFTPLIAPGCLCESPIEATLVCLTFATSQNKEFCSSRKVR